MRDILARVCYLRKPLSLLFQRNVHPKFVQELLGHASVAITLDTYSHMLPGMGSEAADAMTEALG
jgi:integrase